MGHDWRKGVRGVVGRGYGLGTASRLVPGAERLEEVSALPQPKPINLDSRRAASTTD